MTKQLSRQEARDLKVSIKSAETCLLYLLGTTIASANDTTGLITLLTLCSMTVYLHQLGKSRRPGSNASASISGFFSSRPKKDKIMLYNMFRNIINGGDATCHLIVDVASDICEFIQRVAEQTTAEPGLQHRVR